jgi:hypothetical protein
MSMGSNTTRYFEASRNTSARGANPWPDFPSTAAVAELASERGMDLATTWLYQQIIQSRRFGPAIKSILQGPERWHHARSSPLLALVPGAFHGEQMDTGAGGRRFLEIAEAHGFRCHAIATHSFGSLRQNAQVIAGWLEAHSGEEVILIALSKGATEVFHLLEGQNTQLFRNVAAIVNVSGMIFGTRLVNWVTERALPRIYVRGLMWWKNYDFQNLLELQHSERELSPGRQGVPIINVVGFPLQEHLSSNMARRQYLRLRPFGPNDGGGIVLADALRFPGTLFPVWGGDHYLRRPDDMPFRMGQILCAAADPDRLRAVDQTLQLTRSS